MNSNFRFQSPEADELFEAIMLLQNKEECYRFFDDICTIKELQAVIQRFQVAKLLNEHKTYNEIETITGASAATISRVNKCLLYGSDGYKLVLQKLQGLV